MKCYWYVVVIFVTSNVNAHLFETMSSLNLIKNNFKNIQKGKFRFWKSTDCLDILYSQTPFQYSEGCYFENPDAPYGLILLPPHVDEEKDAYFGYPVSDKNMSATWHMKENDVIVLVGATPPSCKYFGFSNYLYSRQYPDNWNSTSQMWSCYNGSDARRCEVFASVSDSINMDRGMNLSQNKFNMNFTLILSQNIEAVEHVRNALIIGGENPETIINYTFPGKYFKLGIETKDDTFTTLMRTAFFDNIEMMNAFFDNPGYQVIRMELIADHITLCDKVPLIDRKASFNDASLIGVTMNSLNHSVNVVATEIIKQVENDYTLQVTRTQSRVPDNGFECIDGGYSCFGDCRDTFYPFSLEIYRRSMLCEYDNSYCVRMMNATLLDDDALLVVGVNHAMTNMSKYTSISVYDSYHLWGVASAGDSLFFNTSQKYIETTEDEELKKALPYIYVYEVRRNCQNIINCLEIPYSPSLNKSSFVSAETPISVTERLYNNPYTHVGPYYADIILPIIIRKQKL